MTHDVTLILGDGVGPELAEAARLCVDATGAAIRWDVQEAGVDVMNISQPNLYDIQKLGAEFGGKVCFMCPVSYQTTSLNGTREEIFKEVRTLVENLGRFNGGFVGYMEEYHSIGLSDENYRNCEDAFREYGK